MEGRISLHRKILDRGRSSDPNTFSTFVHCLLKANVEDKEWKGTQIKRGSFITSIGNLADDVGITRKQMLLVLERLEKGQQIVTNRDNKSTMISIVKYCDYQDGEGRKVQQRDNKGTSKVHQRDTTNKDNNIIIKEINNISSTKVEEKGNFLVEDIKTYGDPEINECLEIIAKYNNGILDGSKLEQRQYGKLLVKKLNKIDSVLAGKYTRQSIMETILGIISENQFHASKISGPKKIYNELGGLMQICRQEFKTKEKKSIGVLPGV